MRASIALALLAVVPVLVACSGDDGGGSATTTTTTTTTATTTSTTTTTTKASVCGDDARATPYADGLRATSKDGAVAVRFVRADPKPPAKGENAFTVAVEDGAGAALADATVAVIPFMPDHGHGASTAPVVAAGATPGTYEVTAVDLFMPGIWQLTFRVTPAGGAAHDVVFTLCVDG
jgi:hypothetical protein